MEVLPQPRPEPFADATEHLRFELGRLELSLERQVLRLRAAHLLSDDPFRGLYIADDQVDALLAGGSEPEQAASPRSRRSVEDLTRRLAELDRERAERLEASRRAGVELPLARFAELFELDGFEQQALLVALAPEVDRCWETLYAYVQNDVTRKRPTAGLVLDLAGGDLAERLSARAAFAPEGRLLRHRLVRLVEDPQEREPALLGRNLKVEDRVVDHLLGGDSLDAALLPFTERVEGGGIAELPLAPEVGAELERAAAAVAGGGVVLLQGASGAGKRQAAAALAAGLGRPLLAADLGRMTAADGVFESGLALLRREALLIGAGLLLEHLEALLEDEGRRSVRLAALGRELADPVFPLVVAGEVPWEPGDLLGVSPFVSLPLPAASFSLRRRLWREALGLAGARAAEEDVADVAGKFVLTPGRIRAAGHRAVQLAAARGGQGTVARADLHAGARSQSGQGLRRLAQRVEPVYTWSDIVLPRRAMRQLEEVYATVEHRARVYSDWGFETRLALGKGTNVLFAGPSGTGKTMAASILARELHLDLYKIDLATVISKYIGETEKNLARIFREAQASNAILFFDEADALFGKRSQVKDSHDRYANIEVAYLLQRMEEYEGISILATNLRKSLDQAFARRLHHTVDFPLPDEVYREQIWRRIFPPAAPVSGDADFAFLARRFELSGGNIKNVALAAAFLAAEEGSEIAMEHLIHATARELRKIGKLPTRSEFREYYELIRERG